MCEGALLHSSKGPGVQGRQSLESQLESEEGSAQQSPQDVKESMSRKQCGFSPELYALHSSSPWRMGTGRSWEKGSSRRFDGLRCSCVFGVSGGMALISCKYSHLRAQLRQASVGKQLPSKSGRLTCLETIEKAEFSLKWNGPRGTEFGFVSSASPPFHTYCFFCCYNGNSEGKKVTFGLPIS